MVKYLSVFHITILAENSTELTAWTLVMPMSDVYGGALKVYSPFSKMSDNDSKPVSEKFTSFYGKFIHLSPRI